MRPASPISVATPIEQIRIPKSDRLVLVASVLLLAMLFFYQTIFQSTAVRYVTMAVVAILLLCSKKKFFHALNMRVPFLLLLLFYALCAFQIIASGQMETVNIIWLAFSGLGLLLCVQSSALAPNTINVIVKYMAILGLFHACATILMFVFPALCTAAQSLISTSNSGSNANGIVGTYRAGFTAHYSLNAIYLALGSLSAFSAAMSTRKKRWGIILAVLLVALILTSKRTALASTVIIVIALTALSSSRSYSGTAFKVFGILAAIILILLLLMQVFPSLANAFSRFLEFFDDEFYLGSRDTFNKICLNIWAANPLFGAGWDSYSSAYLELIPKSIYTHPYAHNVYLQVLAEQGLFGFILLFGAALTIFVGSIREFVRQRSRKLALEGKSASLDSTLLVSLAFQAYFLFYCFTGNPLYDAYCFIPYLFSLGLYFSARGHHEAHNAGKAQKQTKHPKHAASL